MPLKMYGVFSLATFANSHTHKTIVLEVRFHDESFGTSPVKIARIFKSLQGPTQRKPTIVVCTTIVLKAEHTSNDTEK